MNEPLFTAAEARARATELLKTFDSNPDALSPDEQALAMAIRTLERAGQDMVAQLRDIVAKHIVDMARSHYARDIRGELALMNWEGVAQALRESQQSIALHAPSA